MNLSFYKSFYKKTFSSDARQPEVTGFHSWPVVFLERGLLSVDSRRSKTPLLSRPRLRVDFQCDVIFTCVTCEKFTFANKIEAMYERLPV